MKVGVPKEVAEGEERVGLVPETVGKLVKDGFEVLVESGAGRDYNLDENYEDAGAKIVQEASEVYGDADIIVKVARPADEEIGHMHEGQVLVCFVNGPAFPQVVKSLAEAGVTVFSNEAVPRTSAAQAMDALSSVGSIAGYKCALIGADTLGKYVPMLTTAAGTTKAANVLVLGVAVAGLQAISTMNRLGANVFAYDIRPETKDQAQSLGATFIDSDDEKEDEEEEDGYEEYEPKGFAKLMASLGFYSFAEPPRDEYVVEGEEDDSEDEEEEDEGWSQEKLDEDQKLIRERVKEMDMIITTVLVPGKEAPKLVSTEMVESMKPGSVIVDLAAESGGNCELTEPGETVEHENVKVLGLVNLPSRLPIHASQLYSRNMYNFIGHITEDKSDEDSDGKDPRVELDLEDEIVAAMCIAHDGEIRHDNIREALENASEESEAK
ncbi:Re/Si-specific NAD(P)(+) transhydrogenase subunit alpha [soil metagenome]